jgi:putative membrane protein
MDWTAWSLDPSLVYVIPAGVLYWLGGRRQYRTPRSEPKRELAFAAGLLTIVLALDSPLDYYADRLFWVHMCQHIMLLSVAPALILLGRPWPRMWRALPMGLRVGVGRRITHARWTVPVRAVARPLPSWIVFCGTIVIWHIPFAYDATLRHQGIHDCEHALFFFTGLLFWAHLVDPGPLRHRIGDFVRVVYALGAMVVCWALAVTLVLIQHPIYGYYASLAHRAGGISALTDQQLAGGVMWVPGSIPFTLTAFIVFSRWLAPSEPGRPVLTGAGRAPDQPNPSLDPPTAPVPELSLQPEPPERDRPGVVTT